MGDHQLQVAIQEPLREANVVIADQDEGIAIEIEPPEELV
jgi:hypothetical protein